MPTGVPRPCKKPACRFDTTAPDGLCEAHRRDQRKRLDAVRGSAASRGYGTQWREIRARILLRDPFCRAPGCQDPSEDIDHIVPRKRGGTDEDSNLQGLCHRHHARKTAVSDGRWT